MAKIHGEAGAYPAREASRRALRALTVLVLGGFITGFASGFVTGKNSLPGILVMCVFASLLWLGERRVGQYFDAERRERLAYARGADGEELVGWILQRLGDEWHIFHGLLVDERGDFDHLVVGPGGLFCISTKQYRGLFTLGSGGELLHNSQPTSVASQAVARTMAFRDRLQSLMGTNGVFVNAVLAVPYAWIDLKGPYRHALIVHQDNLGQTIESAPKRLTTEQVNAYVSAIELMASSSRNVVTAARRAGVGSREAHDRS